MERDDCDVADLTGDLTLAEILADQGFNELDVYQAPSTQEFLHGEKPAAVKTLEQGETT